MNRRRFKAVEIVIAPDAEIIQDIVAALLAGESCP